jgi:hypothetical protein
MHGRQGLTCLIQPAPAVVQGDVDVWVWLIPSEDDPNEMVVDTSKADGLTPLLVPSIRKPKKKEVKVREYFCLASHAPWRAMMACYGIIPLN